MGILTKMEKLADHVQKLLENISFVLFFFCMLFAVEQVISRNVANRTIPWAEEIIIFAMLFSLFLLSSVATRKDSHIKLDMLTANVRGKTRMAIDLVVSCLEFGTSVFLLVVYVQYEMKLYKSGSVLMSGLGIPMWIMQMSLGIAFAGIVFFSLLKICQLLYARREGN